MKLKLIAALWLVFSSFIITAQASYLFPVEDYNKKEDSYIPIETIWLEASGDSPGTNAMQAVAEVIRTRAKHEHSSLAGVCMRRYQFSCWNQAEKKKSEDRLRWLEGHEYQRAAKAWADSENSNLTHNATHYANLSYCSPSWAREDKKVAQIGSHTFYKL